MTYECKYTGQTSAVRFNKRRIGETLEAAPRLDSIRKDAGPIVGPWRKRGARRRNVLAGTKRRTGASVNNVGRQVVRRVVGRRARETEGCEPRPYRPKGAGGVARADFHSRERRAARGWRTESAVDPRLACT